MRRVFPHICFYMFGYILYNVGMICTDIVIFRQGSRSIYSNKIAILIAVPQMLPFKLLDTPIPGNGYLNHCILWIIANTSLDGSQPTFGLKISILIVIDPPCSKWLFLPSINQGLMKEARLSRCSSGHVSPNPNRSLCSCPELSETSKNSNDVVCLVVTTATAVETLKRIES